MAAYSLPEHVHAAIRGEDLVLLDVVAGQYFCVPAAAQGLCLAPASREVQVEAPDLADALVEAGLISRALAAAPRPPLPGPVRREASSGGLSAHLSLTLAGGALRIAAGQFHGRSFAQLLSAATCWSGRGRADLTGAKQVAGQFAATLPWIPFQGDCLYRSFVLRGLLARRGLAALWVFGVQTWPFEAHCWLQVEDMVLDDTCDHVSGFTPILAV